MNRAQQRAAARSKRSAPRGVNKIAAWHKMQAKLFCHSVEPTTDAMTTELLLPVYAAITKLTHGLLGMEEFTRLNEMNAFGYILAGDIFHAGDAQTKDVVEQAEPVFSEVANALESIGIRWRAHGKFGASGAEFQAIRNMAHWLGQLCAVASQGMVLAALLKAEDMVAAVKNKGGFKQ